MKPSEQIGEMIEPAKEMLRLMQELANLPRTMPEDDEAILTDVCSILADTAQTIVRLLENCGQIEKVPADHIRFDFRNIKSLGEGFDFLKETEAFAASNIHMAK